MKLISHILTIAFASILTACHIDHIETQPTDAISFSTSYVESKNYVSTRALVGDDFASGEQVNILGYFLDDGEWNSTITTPATNETPSFMYKETLTKEDNGSWSYHPPKYWSNDPTDRYRFFGYYPALSTSVRLLTQNSSAGYPQISYTTYPTTYFPAQTDLMYAQTDVVSKSESLEKGVELPFNHALSKIRISGKMGIVDDEHRSKYVIKSIKINAPTKATLSGSPSGASWSGHNSPADWNFNLTTTQPGGTVSGTEIPKKDETAVMLVGGTDENDALLLIPQNDSLKISIVFDYYYSVRPSGEYEYAVENLTYEVGLDDKLEAGKAYHYALSFTGDHKPRVDVASSFTDWGGTFDIETEVAYTYLYVEKPDFTLEYITLDDIYLNVYFSTNADSAQISVEYVRDSGISYPSDQLENTIELIYDEIEGWYARCKLKPSLSYDKEKFVIKAGLIGIEINIDLIAIQPYYLMDPKQTNRYLRLSPEVGEVTETMYSNCYFITPDDRFSRKYFIPITEQIAYAQGSTGGVLTNDTWKVKLYAYDNVDPVNMLWLYNEGKVGYKGPDPTNPDIHYEGPETSCFSITIPPNYTNYGNMLVVVTDEADNILWTWHLWISNYDPYAIYEEITTPEVIDNGDGSSTLIFYSSTYAGSIYRHTRYDYSYILDRNIGAIAPTYLGHGGLGSTGWITYQFGRPTPLLGYNARFADGSIYTTIRHNVDEKGRVSILDAIQNPNVVYYSETGMDWCVEQLNGYVWNDRNLTHPPHSNDLISSGEEHYYQKSRFDPSPLGYMLPPLKEIAPYASAWKVYKTPDSYEITTYEMSSGNKIFATINYNPYTGTTYQTIQNEFALWSNSSFDSGQAGSLLFYNNVFNTSGVGTPNILWAPQTPRTLGAPARCIDQFEETRPSLND